MSSRGKDNSVLVAKLKRQINKKQLLHGELTQQYNNVRQEHTTLEIAFQTTLEQIESMKDRTAVAASELKDRAHRTETQIGRASQYGVSTPY